MVVNLLNFFPIYLEFGRELYSYENNYTKRTNHKNTFFSRYPVDFQLLLLMTDKPLNTLPLLWLILWQRLHSPHLLTFAPLSSVVLLCLLSQLLAFFADCAMRSGFLEKLLILFYLIASIYTNEIKQFGAFTFTLYKNLGPKSFSEAWQICHSNGLALVTGK